MRASRAQGLILVQREAVQARPQAAKGALTGAPGIKPASRQVQLSHSCARCHARHHFVFSLNRRADRVAQIQRSQPGQAYQRAAQRLQTMATRAHALQAELAQRCHRKQRRRELCDSRMHLWVVHVPLQQERGELPHIGESGCGI